MGEYVTVWRDHEPTKLHWGVPVVRCRDCEFFVRDKLGECCTLMDFEHAGGMADGFCAWGEKVVDDGGQ